LLVEGTPAYTDAEKCTDQFNQRLHLSLTCMHIHFHQNDADECMLQSNLRAAKVFTPKQATAAADSAAREGGRK